MTAGSNAGLVRYPGAGCVVEFLQGNTLQTAWVMEEQGGRLRLLLPNRRETSLAANRILPWAGPQYGAGKSRDEVCALLAERRQARDALAASVNPVEIWELAQGEVEKASAQWLAELTESNPDADHVAAYGQALLACRSHFRFQPPEFEIFSAEEVERRRLEAEARREREELIGGGAEWFRLLWEASQQRRGAPDAALAPPEPVRSRLERLLRARILDPETQEDDVLWKQVSKNLPDDPHLPLLLAQAWGIVPEHYNFWLARAEYEEGDAWSSAFAEEIDTLAARSSSAGLKPLSGLFLSIDSASTRDIDDAFDIAPRAEGGWTVDVVLACPALVWPFGSPLDRAVARRATSVYLPEGDSHMMPERLGTDVFSLLAGRPRPVFLLRCEVDAEGNILSCRPDAGRAVLNANLSYVDCEAALTEEDADNPAVPYLERLRLGLAFAEARRKRRVADGAVIIERPDVDISLSGEGADIEVSLALSPCAPRAQLLVSEMMILANAGLAAWAREQDIPLLFRTQDVAVPREFAGVWRSAPDIARVARAMAPASLHATPRPHAGMGISAYSPVTSPLRRYPDLINEAQALGVILNGAPLRDAAELAALLPGLRERLDGAGTAQRMRPRYWKYLHVRQQARVHGEECRWEAVIAEENDAFVSISLPQLQLMARARRQMFGEKVFPGQRFRVRLGKVNPLRGEMTVMAAREI